MKSEITVRRAAIGDEDALSVVGQATFLETFAGTLGGQDIIAHCKSMHSSHTYGEWLRDPRYALWLVERSPGAAPIGYCVLGPASLPLPNLATDDVELKRIYVLSKFQGGGIGSRLMASIDEHARAWHARRLLLGVYAHNQNAIGFYRRAGFVAVGSRQFLVGAQAYDDTIMARELSV